MKIYIEDEIIELENNKLGLEKFFNIMDNQVNSGKIINTLIIDGIKVYESVDLYIEDNLKQIEEIKFDIVSVADLVNGVIVSKIEYIENAEEALNKLVDAFYGNPNGEDWVSLKDFLEALKWILDSYEMINSRGDLNNILNYEKWNIYARKVIEINELIIALLEGFENSDNILIADIILYEILPFLLELKVLLEDIIKVEA